MVFALHRGVGTDGRLAAVLQKHSAIPVLEAEDREPLLPGRAYLAPAGCHLLVEPGRLTLSMEAPVCHARPSVDVLFESSADAYGERVVGVVLTGTGNDGARGLATIRARGGMALVQDPATAERDEMPRSALAMTPVALVIPLAEIAPFLVGAVSRQESRG